MVLEWQIPQANDGMAQKRKSECKRLHKKRETKGPLVVFRRKRATDERGVLSAREANLENKRKEAKSV
jgi:hypothetical protein